MKTSVRHASKKARHRIPEKIDVQLLVDHPTLGSAGEIVKVRPAFMRNYLHVGNKACYTVNGPRIPVVEANKKPVVSTKPKETSAPVETKAEVEDTGAMSLNELSNLFNTMRATRTKNQAQPQASKLTISEGATDSYSSTELKVIPADNTFALDPATPLTKQYLAKYVYEVSGLEVPEGMIKLKTKSGQEFLKEIDAVGEYTWIIEVPSEQTSVRRNITVEA